MRITSLTVERFRGIRTGAVTFEETTVLIGENDCGRTALLQALALLLGWGAEDGGFAFAPHHFHVPVEGPPGPIRLRCRFEAGGAFPGPGELEVQAERGLAGTIRTDFTFRSLPSGRTLRNDVQKLTAFRRQIPVFWLAAGLMGGSPAAPSLRKVKDQLAEALEAHRRRLLGGTSLEPLGEIEQAYATARELIAAAGQRLLAPEHALGAVLAEISGAGTPRRSSGRIAPRKTPGSAAEKIGTLLLAGAIVDERSAALADDATPLLIVEDPEAHLHPMTLASVWSLLDRIAGQKIVGTHSGPLLAAAPLASLRRLTREAGVVREWRVTPGSLSREDLRRYTYHVRGRRGAANFARCWLLVEGETEYWLLAELARICGYDLAAEGIACVEFAQCGIDPILKVARQLGIEWHLLADGDAAGIGYAARARSYCERAEIESRITLLQERDIEHCFWRYGYADVLRSIAFGKRAVPGRAAAAVVIRKAIDKRSKPYVAVRMLEAAAERGPSGVPAPLRSVLEQCVRLARQGPGAEPERRAGIRAR